MYFLRTYKAGGGDHDPRQIIWAEFQCHCGEKTDFNITTNKTFDFQRIRKCPVCKSFGEDDFINSLRIERLRLFEEREKINVKIFEIDKKIESFELTNNIPKEMETVEK